MRCALTDRVTTALLATAALLAMLYASGCDLVVAKHVTEKIDAKAPAVAGAAEGVTEAVETVTGPLLDEDTAAKGEDVSTTVGEYTDTARGIAETVTIMLPEDKRPYGEAATGILATLAGVAGLVAERFRRRKNAAVSALVKTADALPGGGKEAAYQASLAGVGADVEKAREKRKTLGLAAGSASGSSATSPSK